MKIIIQSLTTKKKKRNKNNSNQKYLKFNKNLIEKSKCNAHLNYKKNNKYLKCLNNLNDLIVFNKTKKRKRKKWNYKNKTKPKLETIWKREKK